MKTALLQLINATIEKIRSLFQSIFNRKENVLEYNFNDDYLDEEIEQRNRRIRLFNKEIGSNPLDHIDWIIENGLGEYNEKYQYFISGDHEQNEKAKSLLELNKHIDILANSVGSYGVSLGSREDKEMIMNLETSKVFHNLSTKDRFLYMGSDNKEYHHILQGLSEYDNFTYNTEIKGGIGNKVLYSFVEHSSKEKTFGEFFDEVENRSRISKEEVLLYSKNNLDSFYEIIIRKNGEKEINFHSRYKH